jgi:hypothetical protein
MFQIAHKRYKPVMKTAPFPRLILTAGRWARKLAPPGDCRGVPQWDQSTLQQGRTFGQEQN